MPLPYDILYDYRNMDKSDRFVAAERYAAGYSQYGHPLAASILLNGQVHLKLFRELPGVSDLLGKNGSPAKDVFYTTGVWGQLGVGHRESNSGFACGCK